VLQWSCNENERGSFRGSNSLLRLRCAMGGPVFALQKGRVRALLPDEALLGPDAASYACLKATVPARRLGAGPTIRW
jgi:hypothetical protein